MPCSHIRNQPVHIGDKTTLLSAFVRLKRNAHTLPHSYAQCLYVCAAAAAAAAALAAAGQMQQHKLSQQQ
jgi:hypothetical protein